MVMGAPEKTGGLFLLSSGIDSSACTHDKTPQQSHPTKYLPVTHLDDVLMVIHQWETAFHG
jgi:hypothetical protein